MELSRWWSTELKLAQMLNILLFAVWLVRAAQERRWDLGADLPTIFYYSAVILHKPGPHLLIDAQIFMAYITHFCCTCPLEPGTLEGGIIGWLIASPISLNREQ